jgi:hypothetical protein
MPWFWVYAVGVIWFGYVLIRANQQAGLPGMWVLLVPVLVVLWPVTAVLMMLLRAGGITGPPTAEH